MKVLALIETDTPTTDRGQLNRTLLRSNFMKEGDRYNEFLRESGLPELSLEDFNLTTETIFVEVKDYDQLKSNVENRKGTNKLVSWDIV